MVRTQPVYIGTSGWSYAGWKQDFYRGVAQKDWLNYCSRCFSAVEINASFYRLQKAETFARWRDQTPPHFRFALKANRYLTHARKLLDPAPSIALERERAQALQDKLAAVLWQLPANYRRNGPRLSDFLAALRDGWPGERHAIEFRHPSWFNDEIAERLSRYQVAVCQSDAADWPLWDTVTTDLVYLRLHGHTRTYASAYSSGSLRRWAERIVEWSSSGRTVHVYFDNDAEGAAPRDALRLRQLVEDRRSAPRS
jgi:uncharacterized protein YecE (DUF72 family)